MKKTLALVLAFAMIFSTIPVAFAEEAVSNEAAALATIGMLEGDGSGVTAEYEAKELDRLTAAIMILKLKGLYEEALEYDGEDNFPDAADMKWTGGQKVLGYLKANPEVGYNGNEKGEFKPEDTLSEQMIYKVLLENLGYKQTTAAVTEGDFAWDETLEFAEGLGLEPERAEKFTVGGLAKAVVGALKTNMKDGKAWIQVLVENGKVDEDLAIAAGLMDEVPAVTAAVKSAKALGNTVVEVTFDDEVGAGAEDLALYAIAGLEVEAAILVDADTVRLTTSAQAPGKTYTLTVDEVKVNFGGKAKVSGAPVLKKAVGTDTDRVELEFDKFLDFESATNLENYEIKDVKIIDIELDEDTVTLVAEDLKPNKTHTVKVTDVKSIDGVALRSATKSFYSRSDKTAPKVNTVRAMTYKRVMVQFNEEIDIESAENIENYEINKGVVIESARAVEDEDNDDEYRIVELTTSALKTGTFTLTVKGVKDASILKNEMPKPQKKTFSGKGEDKSAPTVKNVDTLSRHTILVELADNSRIDWASAEDVSNYSMNYDVQIESAEQVAGTGDDGKMVLLKVSALGEKSQYTLTIENLSDEYGNTMAKAVKKTVHYNKTKTDAAKVTNVNTEDLDTVIVHFSTYVDVVSAKDVANYSINGDIGTPISAKVHSGLKKVTLKVNTMKEGKKYKLTVDGVYDLAENKLVQKPEFIARTFENDIDAPKVVDIYAKDNRVIVVEFDEEVTALEDVTLLKTNNGDFKFKVAYEDNTILEFSDITKSKLKSDNEYKVLDITNVKDLAGNKLEPAKGEDEDGKTVVGILDEYDNILYFWGTDNDPDDIEFAWEQTDVNVIRFTFSEKVKNLTGANFKAVDEDDDPVASPSDIWLYKENSAIKSGKKIIDNKNINAYFKSAHDIKDLLINENGERDGKSTVTADLEDDEEPYIENVEAEFRSKIVVEYNKNLQKQGQYEIYYYDLDGKERRIQATNTSIDDNEVIIRPAINLEARFEYELRVKKGAKDLSGNEEDKDGVYYFLGTDLVEPGNFVKGVKFTNGNVFAVNFAKTEVPYKVYRLENGTPAGKPLVSGGEGVALLKGVDYRVVSSLDNYDFEGIVEEGISIDDDNKLTYDDIAIGDVLYVDGVKKVIGSFVDDEYYKLDKNYNSIIAFRNNVPLYYYESDDLEIEEEEDDDETPKPGEDEIAGKFVRTPFSVNLVEFDMPEGKTVISSAKVNGEVTEDFNVDGAKGKVIVSENTDLVKVVIDDVEYTIIIK